MGLPHPKRFTPYASLDPRRFHTKKNFICVANAPWYRFLTEGVTLIFMHQRTWLSVLTFPLVAAFTYPAMVDRLDTPKVEAIAESVSVPVPVVQDPLAGISDIQDVMGLIRENYVDAPDMEQVIGGGIQGALERAHPMNAYLSPEDLHLGDPGGADIGVRLVKRGLYALVVSVSKQGPAAKAGFQVGDVVRRLDGKSVGPMSAWAVERQLRGPEGSEIKVSRYLASNRDLKSAVLKRKKPERASLLIRREATASILEIPDFSNGRAAEVFDVLDKLDQKLPLFLDLRQCAGGDLREAATVAGLFIGKKPFATIQESGKADVLVESVAKDGPGFVKTGVLIGFGTLGAGEAFCAALKKAGIPLLGERSSGMGIERTRFLLRRGGAVELVNRRWMGSGGEKLDRQGVEPLHIMRLKADEDVLPKALELLDKKPEKTAETRTSPQALNLPGF